MLSLSDKNDSLFEFLEASKARIETILDAWVEQPEHRYKSLISAMRYSVLNGGKRIRTAIIYCFQEVFNVSDLVADHIAAAIEVMHASSLVHDDMPALDNDDLRRGKPSCHIAYGESIALLAGDALLNLSHQIISSIPDDHLAAKNTIKLLKKLGDVIGTEGMIGGQAMEFSFDNHPMTFEEVEKLYYLKTGCLIGCGIQMLALASSDVSQAQQKQLDQFSYHLGLAFQIQDDILDIEGNPELLGKPMLSDEKNERQTIIQMIGLEKSKEKLAQHQEAAHELLRDMGYKQPIMHQLVDYIIKRDY